MNSTVEWSARLSIAICAGWWNVGLMVSTCAVHAGDIPPPPPVMMSTPTPVRHLILDPYAGVDWEQDRRARANFHTHTTESDGGFTPATVIDMYKAANYDVLALTDHDKATWPWTAHGRDPDELGMVAVAGNELSRQHHMLGLFTTFESASYTEFQALHEVGIRRGLAVLCHPSLEWPSRFAVPSLQTPLNPALRSVTQNDFTIETWFRTTKTVRNILMGNYSYSHPGALNLELHYNNTIRVYLNPPASQGAITDLNISAGHLGVNTRDGQWHHLAATREGHVLSLYLNGQLAARQTNVTARFNLQGDFFFLGRDTRLLGYEVAGHLAWPRLWRRALSSNDVSQLALGRLPGEPDAPARNGLLLEYGFGTSGGLPVAVDTPATGPVDDTGGHPDGPFHAWPTATGGGMYSTNRPVLLAGGGSASRSMRFQFDPSTASVHPDAFTYYLDHFLLHPHLLGIEVATPYSTLRLDTELWDGLLERLMPRRPVWGLGVDDLHFISAFRRAWVDLRVPHLDENAVRQALQDGSFTFSTVDAFSGPGKNWSLTPQIEDILHDAGAGTLQIRASQSGQPLPEEAYAWISGGRRIQTGSTLSYRQAEGVHRYVRAEILGSGGKTFTNPFGIVQEVNITGLTGEDKVYDGTTIALASGTPMLHGVAEGDEVYLEGGPTFTFTAPDAGTALPIQVAGFVLGGRDTDAYILVPPVLTATISRAAQTIEFPEIPNQRTDRRLIVAAWASSGLPVSVAVDEGPGKMVGPDVLALTGPGDVQIVAMQPGDSNWAPAPDVARRFQVLTPRMQASGLTWGPTSSGRNGLQTMVWLDMDPDEADWIVMGATSFDAERRAFQFETLRQGEDYEIEGDQLILYPAPGAVIQFYRIGAQYR